jgi:hypothetical protein
MNAGSGRMVLVRDKFQFDRLQINASRGSVTRASGPELIDARTANNNRRSSECHRTADASRGVIGHKVTYWVTLALMHRLKIYGQRTFQDGERWITELQDCVRSAGASVC